MAASNPSVMSRLQSALGQAQFSKLKLVSDLGFVGWHPPPPIKKGNSKIHYRYKTLSKATVDEIKSYAVPDASPDTAVEIGSLELPIALKSNLPKQVVATRYPYGKIGIASLYHATSRCNLQALDFYFGCSALEFLSAERKTGKSHRAHYLAMKVPGTNMIMVHYDLDFGQDYAVPGFQFERLMTGKRLDGAQNAGFTEHVQRMDIGQYKVLMTAEVDAISTAGYPVEIKLTKQGGLGGTKTFFQMVGSGSLTLLQGKHDRGILQSVKSFRLEEMAQMIARNPDVDTASLEEKIIRNMDFLKEKDKNGYFDNAKVYRIDFVDSIMELHPVGCNTSLLPLGSVVRSLLETH